MYRLLRTVRFSRTRNTLVVCAFVRDPPYESTNQLSRGQRDFKSDCLENFTTREYNRRSVGVVRLVSTLHDSYGSYETALRVVRLNLTTREYIRRSVRVVRTCFV